MSESDPAAQEPDRRKVLSTARWCGLALGGGALAGFGHVPYSIIPLAILGFALVALLCVSALSVRSGFLAGWLSGSAYFGVTLFWIVEPFFIDPDTHAWMAPFAAVLLATGLALFWGLAFGLATWLSPTGSVRRAVGFVVALGLIELARAYIFTGFPWVIPAYIWVETDARGWASLLGSHGLTVMTLTLSAFIVMAGRDSAARIPAALGALVLGTGLVLGGAHLLPAAAEGGDETRPIVRLVQPNARQNEKWDPEKAIEFVRRQIRFTSAPAERSPDLIVWPETAIPWLLERAGPVLGEISAAASGAPVILGVQRLDDGQYFNGLAVLGPSGVPIQTYDKHHLVPFGEYMPFPAIARASGIRGIAERADGSYGAGAGPELLDLGQLGLALPLICYEVIFPQNLRGTDRPDFLVNITNDAWFGQFAGPHQHLAQARMRTVEQALPMVRAANTGVSAMIDAGGRVLDQIPMDTAGYLDVPLPAAGPATVYASTGDWPAFFVLISALAGLTAMAVRNRH